MWVRIDMLDNGLKVKLVKQFTEHQKTADKGGCEYNGIFRAIHSKNECKACDVMRKRIYQN